MFKTREKKREKRKSPHVKHTYWDNYPDDAQMSEKNLGILIETFLEVDLKDDTKILNNKKIPGNRDGINFRPDFTLLDEKIIFEFDGHMHYQHPFHIEADKIKKKEIVHLGYKRIRWPYYFQLTKDVAKFIFAGLMFHFDKKNYYSDAKYYECIKKIYKDPTTEKGLEDEKRLYAPGFHETIHVPSSFNKKGIERFIDNFKWKSNKPNASEQEIRDNYAFSPPSLKHQVIKSLKLYLKDVEDKDDDRRYLIIPVHDKEFMKFFNEGSFNDEYCKLFYQRIEQI